MKRVFTFVLSLIIVLSSFTALSLPVNALTFTKEGDIKNTGEAQENTIHWVLSYNRLGGKAELQVTGKGFIPNAVYDQTWHMQLAKINCKLTKATIGEGITSLMEGAFSGEDELTEVSLPDSLEHIGDGAFAGTGLTTMFLPKGLKSVKGTCFANSKITEYVVSDDNPNITSVDGVVYSKNLKTLLCYPVARTKVSGFKLEIPSHVEIIGEGAFMGASLGELEIPSTVKIIGKSSFVSSKISKIYINNGVEAIYNNAFFVCEGIKEAHIPNSVKYVGMYSLGYFPKLDYEGLEFDLDREQIDHKPVNETNAEYYASLLGYTLDVYLYFAPLNSVKIYAPNGSKAQEYAENNGFKYVKSQALTPKITGFSNSYNGVTLSWTRSTDATGYYIYRKDLKNKWRRIAVLNGQSTLSYLDKGAFSSKNNIYTVRAFNETGYSACNMSGVKSSFFIKAPEVKSIYNTLDGISVNWYGVQGAKYYRIYRKPNEASSWKYVARVSSKNLKWVDKNVSEGDSYIYTLRTDTGSKLSLYNQSGYNGNFTKAPDFKVVNGLNGIDVLWQNKPNIEIYRVYRKTENSSWRMLKELDGSENSFTDTEAKDGETYIYTVRSRYKGKLSSFEPKGKTVYKIEAPLNIKLYNTFDGVRFSWNKCESAKGYYVYRKNTAGNWKRVAVLNNNNILSYNDKNVEGGTDYTYTVRSFNGKTISAYELSGKTIRFLKTPNLEKAYLTDEGVKIEFESVLGADSYRVYRKTNNGSWRLIDEIDAVNNIYVDKNTADDDDYIYTVRARFNGKLSDYYDDGIAVVEGINKNVI